LETTKVKSLSKALNILECFNSKNPELGITQISNMLDLNKSNVSSIVSTFEQKGYLEKNTVSGKYRLGLKLLEYSYAINENLGYQRMFYDIMKDVSKNLNAITYFAIPRNGEVFYLFNSYPPAELYNYPYRTIIGEKAPMYCTALGKAMMAHLTGKELEEQIRVTKEKFTEHTITEDDVLRKEIALVRTMGYSLDNEEHEYGIRCIGVPIFTSNGTLVGAISASSSTFSFEEESINEYVKIMKEAAFHMRERI
jgi:IclR family transcriptional regulator, KDG regulon repressor